MTKRSVFIGSLGDWNFAVQTLTMDPLRHRLNPLRLSIKLQILLLCFHTFITDVKATSCSNINRISFE